MQDVEFAMSLNVKVTLIDVQITSVTIYLFIFAAILS